MRVGIFGGSFDPPQVGHVSVAAYALATARLDKLWVVPCFQHAFGKQMSRFEDRDRMCRDAFLPIFGDRVKVLPNEAFWRTQYTFDMVENFQAEYPDTEFVLIVGQDESEILDRWYRIEDLRKMVEFFSVGRGLVGGTGFTISNVSSSDIRNKIRERGVDSVRDLVPSPVLDFIEKFNLYR